MKKMGGLFPGKKSSGKSAVKAGGQRFKAREKSGFNIINQYQPKRDRLGGKEVSRKGPSSKGKRKSGRK